MVEKEGKLSRSGSFTTVVGIIIIVHEILGTVLFCLS